MLIALAFLVTSARGQANTLVGLSADRIEFYYDRFLIEADGHVKIQTSDGFSVEGESFSMDLKLNRFLIAGHVKLTVRGQSVTGAAVSDFLDFNRIYFVPITSEPDRWTFIDGDLAHPVKGRIMPGDVFYFPQIDQPPSMLAKSATIDERTFVRLIGVTTFLAGAPVPLPSYVVNFSTNSNFAQNSLSGATADVTWNFYGGPNTLSAVHLRYDQQNYGPYLGFEQHIVGDNEYAVFSVSPATRAGKYFNLMLGAKFGERFQIQTFSQAYVYQYGLKEPEAATQWTYAAATYALPHSYLTATTQFVNYNLLSPAAYFTPFGVSGNVGSLGHPTQWQLTWSSFQNKLFKHLPFYLQTYAGYGQNHDTVGSSSPIILPTAAPPNPNLIPVPPFGLQEYQWPLDCVKRAAPHTLFPKCFPGTTYTNIFNQIVGYTVSLQSTRIGDPDRTYQDYYLNASYNQQQQFFSLPHRIYSENFSASLSRQFSRQLNAYLAYQISNTGDYYICHTGPLPDPATLTKKQQQYLPSCGYYVPAYAAPQVNGVTVDSFTSFRGVATLRTLSLGANFVPSPEFNATLLFRKHADFPVPYPGLFPNPPTNVLGQYQYGTYLGQPPYDITPEIRARLFPHVLLDVSRTYFFGPGFHYWQPQAVVQILP